MIERKHAQTILIVDDELELLRLVGRILRLEGYDVLEASNASEAISVFGWPETDIHLVLTDFNMPGTNGQALAKLLQRFRPTVPVLYMSGSTYIVQTLTADGLPCIQKPFALPDLLNFIRTALVPEQSEPINTSTPSK